MTGKLLAAAAIIWTVAAAQAPTPLRTITAVIFWIILAGWTTRKDGAR